MRRSTQADIVFLSIAILWGSSFALAKGALAYTTPILFVIFRFVLAGAIWGVLWKNKVKNNTQPGTWLRGLTLGGLLGGGFILQTIGLELTTASMSGFIMGLWVVIVPLLVIVIRRTLPKTTSIIGVVICTMGLWVLASPSGAGFNWGDLLTLGSAICFAFHIVFVEMFTASHDTRVLTLIQGIGILAISVPALFLLESPAVELSWPFIWRWLVLGTMAAVTLAMQIHWQRFITATRAAVIITLETPLAAFFAFLLLGEMLTGPAYAGGGLIFLGALVAEGGARLFNNRNAASRTPVSHP